MPCHRRRNYSRSQPLAAPAPLVMTSHAMARLPLAERDFTPGIFVANTGVVHLGRDGKRRDQTCFG